MLTILSLLSLTKIFKKKKNLTILELIHLINLKKKLFTKGTKCQQCLITKAPGIENVTKETLL
jgi:hypothetical protein